jgi:hypothetical protein
MYQGWVHAFSEVAEANEVLLRDVKVLRNSMAEELYEVDALYLSRDRSDLTIEFSWTEPAAPVPVPQNGGSSNGQNSSAPAA